MKYKSKYVRVLKGAPKAALDFQRQKGTNLYVSSENKTSVFFNDGNDNPIECPKEFVERVAKVKNRTYKKKRERKKWTEVANYNLLARLILRDFDSFTEADKTQLRQKIIHNYSPFKLLPRKFRDHHPMSQVDYFIIMECHSEEGIKNNANRAEHIALLTFRSVKKIKVELQQIREDVRAGSLGFSPPTPTDIYNHCRTLCPVYLNKI